MACPSSRTFCSMSSEDTSTGPVPAIISANTSPARVRPLVPLPRAAPGLAQAHLNSRGRCCMTRERPGAARGSGTRGRRCRNERAHARGRAGRGALFPRSTRRRRTLSRTHRLPARRRRAAGRRCGRRRWCVSPSEGCTRRLRGRGGRAAVGGWRRGGRGRCRGRGWSGGRASALPLDGAFDQAVWLVCRPEDLVFVLHPERREVIWDVVLVGEGQPYLLDLGERLEHGLAYAVERVLHRGAVMIREGGEDPVPHATPETVEVEVSGLTIGPLCGNDGGEDAVVGVGEGREALLQETLPPRLCRLHHEEVVEPGLHAAVAALVSRDLRRPLAGAADEGVLVAAAVNLDPVPRELGDGNL